MPKRSSKKGPDEDDPNVTAFAVVQQATVEEEPTGPQLFAKLIREIQDGLGMGKDPDALAGCLWPTLSEVVTASRTESNEELAEGLREWREARHLSAAAELGSKGGKKGGKARAKALTPERRSEIAKKAAKARWKDRRD